MYDSVRDYEETQLTKLNNELEEETFTDHEEIQEVCELTKEEIVIEQQVPDVVDDLESVLEIVEEPQVVEQVVAEPQVVEEIENKKVVNDAEILNEESTLPEEIVLTEEVTNKKGLKKRFLNYICSFFRHDKKI